MKMKFFIQDFYKSDLPYHYDWGKFQDEAKKYYKNPELLKNADILTIRKLLTLYIRKERFCEGHLLGIIKSGHMVEILNRLYEIVKEKL